MNGTIQDGRAGTIIFEYRGPEFLQSFVENNGLRWFDRVTKISFGGTTDPSHLDLTQFHQLELVKSDMWFHLAKVSDDEKWKTIENHPVAKKLKQSFSDCQLSIADNERDLAINIAIDQTAVRCSTIE